MKEKSQGFGSKIGFILAAAGSAIGLGNLWGFPYKAGMNGGAAFVLVYIVMVLIIGCVVMLAEMYIGQRSKRNVVDSFTQISKKFKWAGILAVIAPFVVTGYYIVIGGWSLKYAVSYLGGSGFVGTDSSAYFQNFISSPIEPIIFALLILVSSLFIVVGGVEKGIEKFSKIVMPLLFLCLLIIVVRSLTLGEGVKDALDFYILKFDFKALGLQGVLAAMGQAFFSLSLGMGTMIAYGSYSKKDMKLSSSVLIICGLDTIIAILAGFAIFPAVFAYGLSPTSGPGLLFVVLAEVFSKMTGGAVFGFIFFILVVFAAITSIISLLEVVSQTATEKKGWSRKKAILIAGSVVAVINIFVSLSQGAVPGINIMGFDLLTLFDEVVNIFIMPVMALMVCISVGWMLKTDDVIQTLRKNGDKFLWGKMFKFFVKYVTPLLIFIIFATGIVDKTKSYNDLDLNYYAVTIFAIFIFVFAISISIYMNKKENKQLNYDKDKIEEKENVEEK